MNRLTYLKQTLPKNFADNVDYNNLEFVLLDYNSSDGLGDYIKTNYSVELDAGRLVYFRVNDVKYYNWTHSRNLVASLASGDVICNIDADNFTGKNFAAYVSKMFTSTNKMYLTTFYNRMKKNDVLGRICVLKSDFEGVGGYDESMMHYGFEDIDLIHRLNRLGLQKFDISDNEFLNAIQHSNHERLENSKEGFILKDLYIRYINCFSSELVFLFDDNTFKRGTMINNFLSKKFATDIPQFVSYPYQFSILENAWTNGKYQSGELECEISSLGFIKLESKKLQEEALFFFHQISNRMIMEENSLKGTVVVNNRSKPNTKVYKNFSSIPLEIT